MVKVTALEGAGGNIVCRTACKPVRGGIVNGKTHRTGLSGIARGIVSDGGYGMGAVAEGVRGYCCLKRIDGDCRTRVFSVDLKLHAGNPHVVRRGGQKSYGA